MEASDWSMRNYCLCNERKALVIFILVAFVALVLYRIEQLSKVLSDTVLSSN
jgi:hypothetical protein